MAKDIKTKIALDGEKEYKASLKQIEGNLKTLKSEMTLLGKTFDEQGNAVKNYTGENANLEKQIGQQKEKIGEITKMLDKAKEAYGENDKVTQHYQQALNKAQGELNQMNASLAKNKTEMSKAGNEAKDAAGDTDKLARAADKSEKDVDKLGKAAKDAAKDTDKLGDAAKDSESGFSVMKGAMADLVASGIQGLISGCMQAISAISGIAEETREFRTQMAKVDTAFKDAGLSSSQADRAFSDFFAITGDEGQSTEAVNFLAKMCDNQRDLNRWTTIATGIWGTYGDSLPIESLTEAANETAKTGALTGSLSDALNWAGVNEEGFQAKLDSCNSERERSQLIQKTLNDLYGDAALEYKKQAGGIMDANRAQGEWMQTQARLGEMLEPLSTRMVQFKTQAVNGLLNMWDEAAKSTEASGGTLKDTILTFLANLDAEIFGFFENSIEKAPELIETILSFAAESLGYITSSLTENLLNILDSLFESLPGIVAGSGQLVSTGLEMIHSILRGLVLAVPKLLESLPDLINQIFETLGSLIPQLEANGKNIIGMIINGIATEVPNLIAKMPEIITNLVNKLTELLPQILKAGISLIVTLAKGVAENAPELVKQGPVLIGKLIEALKENLPKILKMGLDILAELIKGLLEIGSSFLDAAGEIIDYLKEAFDACWDRIKEIGKSLVTGLWEGIKGAASWLKEKIFGWGSSVVDDSKESLGVHSPSKKTMEIGKFYAQGLGIGFTDGMDGVVKQIRMGVRRMSTEASATLQIHNHGNNSLVSEVRKTRAAIERGQVITMDGQVVTRRVSAIQRQNTRAKGPTPTFA